MALSELEVTIPFDSKHPILLPKCELSISLMIDTHKLNYHAGPQTLLSIIGEKNWILSGKRLASQILHECVTCHKTNPKTIEQIMAPLPSSRVVPSARFSKSGVDFAGCFLVHQRGGGNRPFITYLANLFVIQQKQFTWK